MGTKKSEIKRRKRKHFRQLLLFLFLLTIALYVFITDTNSKSALFEKYLASPPVSINENYNGIGQVRAEGQDGYTTTFTTAGPIAKTYKEYKQGFDSSWANKSYWDGEMAETGCGITCLSIIASGYEKKLTPEDLRKQYYPQCTGNDMIPALNKDLDIKCTEFYFSTDYWRQNRIVDWLDTNRPILICVTESKWTTESHYMVLLATDGIDKVYVSNPNGGDGTNKASGWYSFDDVLPYIAKISFIEE